MNMTKREADDHTWVVIERILCKSKDPEAKTALAMLETSANEARREWELYCRNFGLKPEQFGKTFCYDKKTYTIIGIKPNSHKYPVLAKSERGTSYKFPAKVVT